MPNRSATVRWVVVSDCVAVTRRLSGAVVGERVAGRHRAHGRLRGVDQASPLGGECVGDQTVQRHVEEVRVGKVRVPVGEGEPRSLEEEVERPRAIGRVEGEALEDVQRLADGRASARRRAHPVDVEPAVAHSYRLALGRGVPPDVAHLHHAGAPDVVRVGGDRRILDRLDHRGGDRATVEALGAEVRDPLVRPSHVGVAEHRADVARSAVRIEVDRRGRRDVVEEVDVRHGSGRRTSGRRRSPSEPPIAGCNASRSFIVPKRRSASSQERTVPGTPAESPLQRASLNASGAPPSQNESGRIAPGAVSRPSIVVTSPSAVRMTMKPPPPIPHENGSVTPSTPAATTAASTAFAPLSARRRLPRWRARRRWRRHRRCRPRSES